VENAIRDRLFVGGLKILDGAFSAVPTTRALIANSGVVERQGGEHDPGLNWRPDRGIRIMAD